MRQLGWAGPEPVRSVLAIGAHSDDIEIGCGGTILSLARSWPEARVHWLVLAAHGDRIDEARTSAEAFLAGLREPTVEILSRRDGYLPYEASEVKDTFEALKARIDPDLVLTHTRDDLHQDHRLVCDLTWNTFRDHLVLEYEIPKYDGDLGRPNAFVALEDDVVARKLELLESAFREPAVEGLVRRRRLSRADASARDGVSLTERVRGGIHCTEALHRGGRLRIRGLEGTVSRH